MGIEFPAVPPDQQLERRLVAAPHIGQQPLLGRPAGLDHGVYPAGPAEASAVTCRRCGRFLA